MVPAGQGAGAGSGKPLVLTPNANMDMLGRIAAANAQLNAFTASLTPETAAPTVAALLASRVSVASLNPVCFRCFSEAFLGVCRV